MREVHGDKVLPRRLPCRRIAGHDPLELESVARPGFWSSPFSRGGRMYPLLSQAPARLRRRLWPPSAGKPHTGPCNGTDSLSKSGSLSHVAPLWQTVPPSECAFAPPHVRRVLYLVAHRWPSLWPRRMELDHIRRALKALVCRAVKVWYGRYGLAGRPVAQRRGHLVVLALARVSGSLGTVMALLAPALAAKLAVCPRFSIWMPLLLRPSRMFRRFGYVPWRLSDRAGSYLCSYFPGLQLGLKPFYNTTPWRLPLQIPAGPSRCPTRTKKDNGPGTPSHPSNYKTLKQTKSRTNKQTQTTSNRDEEKGKKNKQSFQYVYDWVTKEIIQISHTP